MQFIQGDGAAAGDAAMRAMFEARKRVFVDLLGWDLPVLAGRYEVDQFDDTHARYLILTDGEGQHLASARLLPTARPHLLGSLFAELCDVPPPTGPGTWEITRFCLDRRLRAGERRRWRDVLVHAIARYALEHGIAHYVGVAEPAWREQILASGWEAHALGPIRTIGGMRLGALRIGIRPETPALLAANGIRPDIVPAQARAA
ncbi:acyl-homoserine-lactone synthase [Sphingomonas pituitosa]|uniref:acyl-homoserine-lactone synthase n=1 Tax=Sphingomonas pituitosa TaxID=99597 RepID=UPI0008301A66|nr:acyl-homoserine-lactone synthase [Sphingomonas pituitosa]